MPVEAIPVADEPEVKVIPEQSLKQQPKVTEDSVIDMPEPRQKSAWFNSMKEQLSKVEEESVIPSQKAKDHSPAPVIEREPKAEPKAEAKTEPEPEAKTEEDPKTFTSAKAADWKKLKAMLEDHKTKHEEAEKKLQAREKEYAELQAKLQTLDQTPQLTKQIEEIKAQRDKLQSQIESIDLEKSESFIKRHQEHFDAAVAKAKDAAGEQHAERIEQLLQLKPSKWRKERINEIREELTGVDQGQLDIAIANFDAARTRRENELANAKDTLQKQNDLASMKHNREKEMTEARIKETIGKVMETAKQFESFKPVANDVEYNNFVRDNEEYIQKFFRGELAPDEMAVAPILMAEAKRLMTRIVPALTKENTELKEALKSQTAATPKPAGGKVTKEGDNKRVSFVEQVMAQMEGGQ